MKISVIFTGGTIGSASCGGYISPSSDASAILYDFFNAQPQHEFEFISPITILSENITTDDINTIAGAIRSCAASDAVIVTHGTDSLAYSSAALAYLLYDIDIPVVIVSSTHILSDKRANGIQNLTDALTFIEQSAAKGVFVCNNGEIHFGTRLCPPSAYNAECKSILGAVCGRVFQNRFINNKNPMLSEDKFKPFPRLIHRKILTLPALPQFSYDILTRDWDAVLQLSYHSGTVDTGNGSFVKFCTDLKERGVPVYLHGSYNGADYKSKRLFDDLGLRVLPVMSSAAAYMKLMLADAQQVSLPLACDIIQGCEI